MKKILILLLLAPVFCFSQEKVPEVWLGVGYAFYPGSSGDVHIEPNGNPLKSGFTAELTVEKQLNSFLYAGLGSSLFSFKDLTYPYVPVFADIRVIGSGKYKLYSFIDPGYGIYKKSIGVTVNGEPVQEAQKGGFFIAYGFGVTYKMVYLQAKYNWLRFSAQTDLTGKTSKAYGVGGITFGVRLP